MTRIMTPDKAPSTLTMGDLVHLGQHFYLVFVHLGFGFMQKDGIIFVHGEGAAIDQEDDEHPRQYTPRD